MEKITNLQAVSYVLENCEIPEDVRAKLINIHTSLEKSASKKKIESEEALKIQEEVYSIIAEKAKDTEKGMRVADILNAMSQEEKDRLNIHSPQKMTAIVAKLYNANRLEKVQNKQLYYKVK